MQPPRTANFDAIGEAIADYPFVVAAWVFGSVARDDAAADSDLDLAVYAWRAPASSPREPRLGSERSSRSATGSCICTTAWIDALSPSE